jgi:hypothetical protein
MSNTVSVHHVVRVAVADSEREAVMLAIASANQFVQDNYDEDIEDIAYFAPVCGDVLVPLRKDIVGNLLAYVEIAQLAIPRFLNGMTSELRNNGILIFECIGGHRERNFQTG